MTSEEAGMKATCMYNLSLAGNMSTLIYMYECIKEETYYNCAPYCLSKVLLCVTLYFRCSYKCTVNLRYFKLDGTV